MTALRAIGLMSGTSMDGIDLAVLNTDGEHFIEMGPSLFVPYEAAFRRRIEAALETAKAIVRREDRPGDLAALEREITLRHARAVEDFLRDGRRRMGQRPTSSAFMARPSCIGRRRASPCNSATARCWRAKRKSRSSTTCGPTTWLHGGQGAPLVPAYHAALARSLPAQFRDEYPVVFVNVGGISNITYVPATGDPIAFDTGPGNTLIDQWVSREGGVPFDAGGVIASEGGVNRGVVERYLENPFFEKPGPKSLDRNDFTLALVEGLELADGARTLAAVSAAAILKSADSPAGTAEALDRLRRRPQKSAHRRRHARRRGEGGSKSRRCRRGRPQRRYNGSRGLGLSSRKVAERTSADLPDNDGMPAAGYWRRTGEACGKRALDTARCP